LVRRLRPGVLDDLGLVSAVTSLATEFATHTGLRVRRSFDADLPTLDREAELAIYRVAQEGLTNAARHAEAQNVEVSLHADGGNVVMEVSDDGRGVGAALEGAGIRGMRGRALRVGAPLAGGPAAPAGTAPAGARLRLTVAVRRRQS